MLHKSFKNVPEVLKPMLIGKIPKSIKGTYVQNGPGEFYHGGIQSHPFDGDGYIRKIEFKEGNAYFQGRYIQTWQRQLEQWFNVRLFTGAFGTYPHHCLLKNPVNTNVISIDDQLAASSEMGKTYLLDKITLETLGTHSTPISAHTHQGISVERMYTHSKTQLKFQEITVTLSHFVYFHDFAVTPNYYGFMDHGLTMDLWKGFKEGWVDGLTFQHQPTTFYLIHRFTQELISIPIPNLIGFSYHFICAKETSTTLEFQYILYPTFFSNPSQQCSGKVYQTIINKKDYSQQTQCIHTEWMEMPVYDPFTEECFVILPKQNGLGQFHTTTHELNIYKESNKIFNEPFFDKDYVMTLVYDRETMETHLYVFDRLKCLIEPITYKLPISIPMGLHGTYINKSM